MTETNPMDYIHQTAVHQLEHAAEDIEDGNGLVASFDHDEDVIVEMGEFGRKRTDYREVTLELTYLLPE